MMLHMTSAPASSYRPAGALPRDPLGSYAGPWDVRLASHLLRRAGFGGSPVDLARFAAQPMPSAVESLVRFPATDALVAEPALVDTVEPGTGMGMRRQFGGGAGVDRTDPSVMAARKELRLARADQNRTNVVWWLDRMLATPAPLQEKMTLFLHGHFATAANQKNIYGLEIVDQNILLRKYALGNWRELTHAIARDPAMLKWLDQARSNQAHPNENFARELMELFTLGIGNYTEQDVRESARAFTGFSLARRNGPFEYRADLHDSGSKTFLGHTGNFNGDDVIDIIFAQPAAAKFFSRKLLEFFVYSEPEPELVDALAQLIRKHDFNMQPVVATLFRSNVFYQDRTYRALVKSPVDFVIGSYRLFGVREINPNVIGVLGRMGQVPFHPPSVKGWDGGAAWLNTQTILARENFASTLTTSPDLTTDKSWLTDRFTADAADASKKLVGAILQGDASPASIAGLQSYLDGSDTSANGRLSGENFEQRMRGAAYLTMAMPAYQLS
ncbi:MAG: DUF1800 domain-containing protein [Candidatus Eremiobacteraeota bacterium]|nr:DUF1800 domain-containing protein [Candidatus Eremiobacteraeota bacterium]